MVIFFPLIVVEGYVSNITYIQVLTLRTVNLSIIL